MKGFYLLFGTLALIGVIFIENKSKPATPTLSASGQATVNGVTGIATGVASVVQGLENMFKGPSLPIAPQSTQIYTPTNAPADTGLIAPPSVPLLINTDAGTVNLTPGMDITDFSNIGELPTSTSSY